MSQFTFILIITMWLKNKSRGKSESLTLVNDMFQRIDLDLNQDPIQVDRGKGCGCLRAQIRCSEGLLWNELGPTDLGSEVYVTVLIYLFFFTPGDEGVGEENEGGQDETRGLTDPPTQ